MNTPKIRFKEFSTVWKQGKVEEYYKLIPTNSFSRNDLNYTSGSVKNIHYGDIHVKFTSHLNSENEVLPFISDTVNFKRYSTDSMCAEGDIILADASEDVKDIGKSVEITSVNNEKILSGLHTIHLRPISNSFSVGFSGYLFRTGTVVKQIQKESQGAKVLGISGKKALQIKFLFPSKSEQQKIAEFLKKADKRISFLTEKKELLEKYKAGVTKKLFSQELRFKDEDGTDFPDWQYEKLDNLLKYEQPTKYLVTSTEYKNNYTTPVLTAGKTFILGYTNEEFGIFQEPLPVIIFDDFTTSIQFVEFPFKVKSSAMKILKIKNKDDTKYVFEAMRNIRYEVGGHERHWIKIFSHLIIPVPRIEEQNKISQFISEIDEKIENTMSLIKNTELWKKGLLQQMFI